MKEPALTVEFLKSCVRYDPETGIFSWLVRADTSERWNAQYAGTRAGYEWVCKDGRTWYRSIRLLNWGFREHRLAWLYMTGSWPRVLVDHRNLDGLDNRWENLREATKAQNAANSRLRSDSTSGFKGVSARRGKFRATISINKRQVFLGTFETAEEAHAAYVAACSERDGEFARAS